jgi:hypothetical protein
VLSLINQEDKLCLIDLNVVDTLEEMAARA